MTIVSLFFRYRRVLALCAATAALHYVTIDWVGERVGLPRDGAARAQSAPSVTTAQLRLALPQRVAPSAPPPELKPLAPAAPKRRVRPGPKPAAPAPEAASSEAPSYALTAEAKAAAAPAEAQADTDPAQADAAPPPAAVQSAQAPAEAGADAARPPAAPPEPEVRARRFKVDLPPAAEFELELQRTDADGTRWNGVAAMSWQTDGSRYKVSMEAGISMLITRVNLLVLASEGEIDDAGIAPNRFTEKRKSRSLTATHFNREQGRISFSASERSYPLLTGAQDKATVPFQLGAIGRADVNQFASNIDILVGEDKDASIFRFQLVGEEELDTKMGRVVTWHLARPPKPGSYSSRLDIWLAPGLNWYPVQIRNTEASGALTTQTVSKITTTSGK